MNIQAPKRMTVDEYLVWAEGHPGRYELIYGTVRPMSPERVGHGKFKGQAFIALKTAIKQSGTECFAMPDGSTVRVSEDAAFEPDALIYLSPLADPDAIEIANPIIVVEVSSPSTHKYDTGFKLQGYMNLPSIHHILLINGTSKSILHYQRTSASVFKGTTVSDGILRLDPPGLEIPVADFFDVD